MAIPSHHGNTPGTTHPAVMQRIEAFKQSWDASRGSTDLIGRFLPPPGDPLRLIVLVRLASLDLASRWRSGQPVRLERYLESFPELTTAAELPRLIYEEYRVRVQNGDPVTRSTYHQRFPAYYREFCHLLEDSEVRETHLSGEDQTFVPEFSSYQLVHRLGRGQFGEVWKAKAPGGVEVAVKVIDYPLAHKMSQMELRALELIKTLRHPFLVQVHAYWPMEDKIVIVMELADGSLEDRLQQCRSEGLDGIPRGELLTYIEETAEALDYLHSQHVLHRDIKPANCLLLHNHAKLADFGVARLFDSSQRDIRATQIGTPAFMAPEVWRQRVEPHSDQYSLAATYAELLLGRPVFSDQEIVELYRSHTERPPDLHPLPRAEQRVLHRALAKDADQRFANCVEFVAALREAGTERAARRPLAGRGAWQWLLAGLLLLVLVPGLVAGLLLSRTRPLALLGPSDQVNVRAGEEARFMVALQGVTHDPQVQLTAEQVPADVRVDFQPLGGPGAGQMVRVAIGPNVPPGNYDISIRSQRPRLRTEVALHVERPDVVLPAGFRAATGARLRRVEGRNYYTRIVWMPPPDTARLSRDVEWTLIARTNNDDPPTFYMLVDKVWNDLFAAYAAATGDTGQAWRRVPLRGERILKAEDHLQLPVMNVTVTQAHRCAQWLGGQLPSARQWDKAAGLFDHARPELAAYAEAPYAGSWDASVPDAIAVDRARQGPLPAGRARQDKGPFDCRDMAGNGREFTSDTGSGGKVPLEDPGFDTVILRGRSYADPTPLRYADLEETGQREHQLYGDASEITGFRVVVVP